MIRPPPRSTLFPTRRSSDLFGKEDVTDIAQVHHALGDIDAGARYIGAVVHVGDAANGPGVNAHANAQSRRSEEHTSELQSRRDLVCRLLLEKKKKKNVRHTN